MRLVTRQGVAVDLTLVGIPGEAGTEFLPYEGASGEFVLQLLDGVQ
jgi:hypothetical protein